MDMTQLLDYTDLAAIKVEVNEAILNLVDEPGISRERVAKNLLSVVAKITEMEKVMIDRMEKASQSED
ncbi:hypothetical protein [Paenibacillus sp. y28]|uniref:hypothetical protein n=1 Tax=Paenibacillus sp. y28 TaxID=3129110 RepID=UPI003017717E